jgi:hypothetical protein
MGKKSRSGYGIWNEIGSGIRKTTRIRNTEKTIGWAKERQVRNLGNEWQLSKGQKTEY